LRGVPVDNDGNFLADIRWTASEPTDYQYLEANVLQGTIKHRFAIGNGLDTSIALRHIDNEMTQKYHEPRGAVDLDGDGVVESVQRQFRDQFRTNEEYSLTVDNVYVAQLGGMQHTFLIGGDYFDQRAEEDQRTAPSDIIGFEVPSLSLSNPVYGLTSGTNYSVFPVVTRIEGDYTRTGFYIQDQLQVTESLQLLAGYRFESYDNKDRVSGESRSDEQSTWRGGVIYRLAENVSVYGSYSQGFVPQPLDSQSPDIGGPFAPEESQQFEVGIKSELFDGRAQGSIAVYQIIKENVLQPDPDPSAPTGSLISFGEVTSEGIEFDFVGDLVENWVLMLNYAYNDTRITETTGAYIANSVGDRFSNAPRHQAGLWTRVDLPSISSAIAGGFDYIDERLSFSGQRVKPYTTFDLSWHTSWRNLEFQLNAKNLFDKEYAQSGFTSRAGHFPGEPRTLSMQITASF
jgi:iron complex outermembrane receptor protein